MDALKNLQNIQIPYFDTAISLVVTIATIVNNVKVYRRNCEELSRQCVELVLAATENMDGLEGTLARQAADEVEASVSRIHRRMQEWAKLSFHQSIFRQGTIKDGVDAGFRELTGCYRVLSIRTNVDQSRSLMAIQTQDHTELRDMLQGMTENLAELRIAVQQNRSDVPALMESVQIELKAADLEARQEQDFRRMLWELRSETNELPPLPDRVTGQIGSISQHAVVLGGSSDIHSGMWLDREKVALKRHRAFNCSPYAKRRIVQEVEIWRRLHHHHILPLYGVIFFGGHVSMVSPWMAYGNINVFLQSHPNESKVSFLLQVAKGLLYLHEERLVHGDLRGTNILIDDDKRAKIADFGLSKAWEEIGDSTSFTTAPSSVRWSARELVYSEEDVDTETLLSVSTDSWSFGMLCLEVLTSEQPFSHIQRDVKVYSALSSGALPRRPPMTVVPELTNELWNFMMHCWDDHPPSRPAMSDARAFLAQYEQNSRNSSALKIQHAPHRTSNVQHEGHRASISESSSSRRRSSDVDMPYTVAALESAGFSRRPSESDHSYPASYAESISSSSYKASSLFTSSPQFTNTSVPTTAFSTPKYAPQTPSTVKPRTSLETKVSSPPDLKLSSPFPSPPTLSSKHQVGTENQATSITLGGKLATAIHVAPTYLEPSVGPTHSSKRSPSQMWLSRIPALSEPQPRHSDLPPPTTPLAPKHILKVMIEETEDSISPGDGEISRMPESPALVPPPPSKDEVPSPLNGTSQLGIPLSASPEGRHDPLPPSSEIPTETGQSRVRPQSIWGRMRGRNSRPPEEVALGSVFGRPLDQILLYAGTSVPILLPGRPPAYASIPTIVTKCGFWLKMHGLFEVGLFHRELQSLKPARKLRAEFEKLPDYGKKLDMKGRYTAAHAAYVLREFLTELPEPVIPLAYYTTFSCILDGSPSREEAVERVERAFRLMPLGSRELLLYLSDLICTFAKHAPHTTWRPSGPEVPTNMLSLRDLVLTFKPVLLSHPERDWLENEERRCRKVLEFIFENLKRLLDDRPVWH